MKCMWKQRFESCFTHLNVDFMLIKILCSILFSCIFCNNNRQKYLAKKVCFKNSNSPEHPTKPFPSLFQMMAFDPGITALLRCVFCYSNTNGAAKTFQHKFLNYFMTIFIDYVDHVYVHLNKTHENLMGMLSIF